MLRILAKRCQEDGSDRRANMPFENPGKHRKHTPIVSEKQRGLFGAEYRRRKLGLTPRMKGITTEELKEHLKESKGKKLPKKAK